MKTFSFRSSPNFVQKIGPNLSEDLFFWSLPNFGQKNGLMLGETIFILIFVLLKFSEVPGPYPPFQNPAYAIALIKPFMNVMQ